MIELETVGRTLFATFSNPATLNSLDAAMAADLDRITATLRQDSELGLLVLQGEGRAFMAGGDVNAFHGDAETVSAAIDSIMLSLNAFIEAVASAPCLTIASVHGAVAGGGLSIMLACDLVVAAESTKFVFAYAALGTTPDGGLTQILPVLVGRHRAIELLLLPGSITASEAHGLGLVNEVVPDVERDARTRALIERLEANSLLANAQTKALIRSGEVASLREQLAAEKRSFQLCAAGNDFKEGVSAFLEKRHPNFER